MSVEVKQVVIDPRSQRVISGDDQFFNSGPGVRLLRANMDPKVLRSYTDRGPREMRANALLSYDEWKRIETEILGPARLRMTLVNDIVTSPYGLVKTIPNGIGVPLLVGQYRTTTIEAKMSMSGEAKGDDNRPAYTPEYLPLPITYCDWNLDIRTMNMVRAMGGSVATDESVDAAMAIADYTEGVFCNGASAFTHGAGTIRGLTDHGSRITGSLLHAWSASATGGDDILNDVICMKAAMLADRHYGPWMIYVCPAYEAKLDANFVANYPGTIRERLLKIDGVIGIKICDKLASGSVVMVEFNPQTIQAVIGMPLTPVEWQEHGGMVSKFKNMQIVVPRVRKPAGCTYVGIAHYSI